MFANQAPYCLSHIPPICFVLVILEIGSQKLFAWNQDSPDLSLPIS
jgi:hypothetical protein